MGNSLGGRKSAEVMKADGETFKLKTPVQVWEVIKDYPGHVLIESEAVRQFGIRVKPVEGQQELKPRKIYFLLEIPKLSEDGTLRRARSGIHMSAKDRLESLMLSKRSVSDLSMMKPRTSIISESGAVRVRLRVPKVQLAKLMDESKDAAEAAEKIMDLCVKKKIDDIEGIAPESNEGLLHHQCHWKPGLGIIRESFNKQEEGNFLYLRH